MKITAKSMTGIGMTLFGLCIATMAKSGDYSVFFAAGIAFGAYLFTEGLGIMLSVRKDGIETP